MTWSQIQVLVAIFAAAVALFTFAKGVAEYFRQGAQKRHDAFMGIRKGFKENEVFREICDLLENDHEKLKSIDYKHKRDFLGLFEEIAIMTNSRLIRKEVAHYMFGYYAIRCFESKYFWNNINRDSIYWSLFANFAEQMKLIESDFRFRSTKYRF